MKEWIGVERNEILTYECLSSGLEDAGELAPLLGYGLAFSSSRWTAREKRRQKAGSRMPAILYVQQSR